MGDDQTKRGVAAIIPRRPRPRIVSMRIWSLAAREPASGCPPSKPSGKVPDTHSVGSICDHDFGVFTVTNIATENTDAVPPAHPVSRMPKPANQGLQRCRGPRVSLTCLAPLAAWQSLCTGHLDASLKPSALTFTEPGPPEQEAAEPSARPLLRQRGRVVNTDRRGSVFPIQVSGSGPAGERDPNAPRREMCLHLENGDRCKSDKRSGLETRSHPLFDRAAMSGGTRA